MYVRAGESNLPTRLRPRTGPNAKVCFSTVTPAQARSTPARVAECLRWRHATGVSTTEGIASERRLYSGRSKAAAGWPFRAFLARTNTRIALRFPATAPLPIFCRISRISSQRVSERRRTQRSLPEHKSLPLHDGCRSEAGGADGIAW